jgi:hypothetical protein
MEAADRGQQTIAMSFGRIEEIIGSSLPPSSTERQWWANSSHTQALAWRAADFHVEQVDLDRKQVRFARGPVGGTAMPRPDIPSGGVARDPVDEPIEVKVRLQWRAAGIVELDASGKPTFGDLEQAPGLYRLTLAGAPAGGRARVYIGESDNLRRRLTGNYRNPGPSQQTSLRINAMLRDHLLGQGVVEVAVATAVSVWLDGVQSDLDLNRKSGRLLAENAALVDAQQSGLSEVVNLG